MLLKEINPFIRYINRTDYLLKCGFTVSYDYRLFYVTSGTGRVECSNQSKLLQRGALFFHTPGTPYQIISTDHLLFYTVNFDFTRHHDHDTLVKNPEPIAIARPEKILELVSFEDAPAFNHFLFLNHAHFAEAHLGEILEEFTAKRMFYSEICSHLLGELLTEIARRSRLPEKAESVSERVLALVRNHYANPELNTRFFAAELHYHENYLNSLVKMHTGMSLHHYIQNYRLTRASVLLCETNLSIAQIAEQVGFVNSSHFATAFSREYGCSPSVYRKKSPENR